ncbi:MAG: cytochrome c biogenesis protein CcsA [Bacteroidota bacterium]
MKRILNILFSSATTIVLLLILIVSMASATFIEDKFDTATARSMVYGAKWFEFVFLILMINFIGHISKYKMLSRKKIAGFVFHAAFIMIILGAGITRYFGFEGNMHIREGEASNVIFSSDPYLQISAKGKDLDYSYEEPLAVNELADKSFHKSISYGSGSIGVAVDEFIPNAIEKLEETNSGGLRILEITHATMQGAENIDLDNGQMLTIGTTMLAFNNHEKADAVHISDTLGTLQISAPGVLVMTEMNSQKSDSVPGNTNVELKQGLVYKSNGFMFLLAKYYKNAKKTLVSGSAEEEGGSDALVLGITVNGKKNMAIVRGGKGYRLNPQEFTFDGLTFKLGMGEKQIQLPFSIYLRDFILDRYAGSMSPSSYASEVTLIDNRDNLKENHRIFMNNVLDYNKYRFFQSSYDMDEKGTVLSVNHDYYGTKITYLGYTLLGIGFLLSLLNKNSRFLMLRKKIVEIRNIRKAALLLPFFMLFSVVTAFSQNNVQAISKEHANKFGLLLVQTFDGRFQPVNSLAYDLLHKISRKDNLNIEGKGKLDATQIMLDMTIHPDFWKMQKIILIREKSVADIIGLQGKYASFQDFFDEKGQYKLQKNAEEAFRKKQSEQNTFDKELIKVDERLNIVMTALKGSMLKLFPELNSANNKWISWDDKDAQMPLPPVFNVFSQDLQLSTLNYSNIAVAYFTELSKATVSGDYSKADKILGYIGTIQQYNATAEVLNAQKKAGVEVIYNKLDIFITLRNFYAVLSMVLLALAFIDNLKQKKSKLISLSLNISIGLLGLGFLYHTLGLILRWYLSGHAPWSNGYESLLLVAWGGLLAGFTFARYSKITVAATALLAFFMLMTASHSSYDPQLTNLQPVLKSYWLIIHVATLTISYGFLGLGLFLGMMNLVIYLFKTTKNASRLDLVISELTYINEMNLTVGLVLATLGTFLGGVWANESWGRYWGWDAKETWALVIVLAYTIILHLRMIPKMKSAWVFNVGSVIGFGSVVMTFVGVNYYLSKGMHSYAAGDTPVFPLWAWGIILSVVALIVVSGIKDNMSTTLEPKIEEKKVVDAAE